MSPRPIAPAYLQYIIDFIILMSSGVAWEIYGILVACSDIMVEANLAGEVPHVIKSITGVIGFLGETKGGEPVPMRRSEVNRMLGKVDELAIQDENIAIPYSSGETVKVIDGPFNGFDGTIEKINEEKRKLEVMVKIFGRKTPLELSYMQVDKI